MQLLLCDSAYPRRRHLLPVYKQEAGLSEEERRKRKRFNKLCSAGTVLVESTLGTLKTRMPYVYDEMRQRKLQNSAKVIMCAVSIHNFLVKTGSGYLDVQLHEEPEDEEADDNDA